MRKNGDKENNDYMLRQMNSCLSKFDVGSLSSINPTGNRSSVYVIKDKQNREEVSIIHYFLSMVKMVGHGSMIEK